MKLNLLTHLGFRPARKTRIRPRVKLDPKALAVKLETEDRELFVTKCDSEGISPSERLRTLVLRDIADQDITGKSSLPGGHLDRIRREFELAFADKNIDVLERDRLQYLWSLFERDVLYAGSGEAA